MAVYWSSTRRQTAIPTGSKEMQKIASRKKLGKETTKETWAEGGWGHEHTEDNQTTGGNTAQTKGKRRQRLSK